jgi:hypothetical protein
MAGWLTKRVLIAVRTYPAPAQKTIEASCTGGITDNGEWIRLFPVPYRLMDEEKRFRKWQWIEVDVLKAKDGRPESYKINIEKITPGETLGTKDGWRARREIVNPLIRPSMCHIRRGQRGRRR